MTYTHVQALRAFLSIGVVLMHLKFYLHFFKGDVSIFQYVPGFFGGFSLVFYAVSGYFMAFLVDRKTPNFAPQRIVRVYPTYFLALLIGAVLRCATNLPSDFSSLPQVMSLLPLGPGYRYKLGIEWTLLYEIFCYIICTVFCRPSLYRLFPRFLVAWMVAILVKNSIVYEAPIFPTFANIWLSGINYSFICGGLAFFLLKDPWNPACYAWGRQLTLLSMLAIAGQGSGPGAVFYGFGVLSFCVLVFLIKLEYKVRAPKLLSLLGDYSYALYLIHSSVLIMVIDRWRWLTGHPPGLIAGLAGFTLCMAAFWYLGQVDVAMHKRLKDWVTRTLSPKKAAKPVPAGGAPAPAEAVIPGRERS